MQMPFRIIAYSKTIRSCKNIYRNKKVVSVANKLVLFYKMFKDLTSFYVLSLVSPLVQNAPRYNLRNSKDTQTIVSCTYLFYNSYLPSTIGDWNRLNPDIRNADMLDAFNYKQNQTVPVIPNYFYLRIRKYQIWQTRIRTCCSSLKNDLLLDE